MRASRSCISLGKKSGNGQTQAPKLRSATAPSSTTRVKGAANSTDCGPDSSISAISVPRATSLSSLMWTFRLILSWTRLTRKCRGCSSRGITAMVSEPCTWWSSLKLMASSYCTILMSPRKNLRDSKTYFWALLKHYRRMELILFQSSKVSRPSPHPTRSQQSQHTNH